jgi:hypothetical protein
MIFGGHRKLGKFPQKLQEIRVNVYAESGANGTRGAACRARSAPETVTPDPINPVRPGRMSRHGHPRLRP